MYLISQAMMLQNAKGAFECMEKKIWKYVVATNTDSCMHCQSGLGWTHTCQKNDDVGMTGSTGVASYAIVRTWYVQRQKTLERPSEETGLSKLIQQIEAA